MSWNSQFLENVGSSLWNVSEGALSQQRSCIQKGPGGLSMLLVFFMLVFMYISSFLYPDIFAWQLIVFKRVNLEGEQSRNME